MNSRKRYHIEVDRLSRIEEDMERLSMCGDQPNTQSPQLMTQRHLQRVHDKLLESIPTEQHFMIERGQEHLNRGQEHLNRGQEHLNRDDKLLQHIQQQKLIQQQTQQQQFQRQQIQHQQMLKQIHANQAAYQETLNGKHFQHIHQENQPSSRQTNLGLQQTNPDKQYCRFDLATGEVAAFHGNHYQHLADFCSGRTTNFESQPCNHQAMSNQKTPVESPENYDGAKFLKEKYDSLGKMKVPKPSTNPTSQDQTQHEQDRLVNQFPGQDAISQSFMSFNGPQREHFPEIHYFHGPQMPQHQDGTYAREETNAQHESKWRQQQNNLSLQEEQNIFLTKQAIVNQQQNLKLQQPLERRLLNEHDLMQVDIFYRSQRSNIFVSRCCASLMMGPKWSFQSTGSLGGSPASGVRQLCRNFRDWACVKSGVPVLVLDTTKNELCLILAEHGSGFALWRNRMGPLTGYSVIAADFHALRTDPSMQRSMATNPPSTLVTSIVGLNFVDMEAAEEFYKNVVNLSTLATSLCSVTASNRNRHVSGDHPNDSQHHSLSNSTQDLQASDIQINKQNGEKTKNSKKNKRSFSKTDISQPCCFSHVTKLGDRFRDGSSRLFLTTSDTNVLVRGAATIDNKSALNRLHSGLKPKH